VSLGWITSAAQLAGKALQVALLLAHRAGVTGRSEVVLSLRDWKMMGVAKDGRARALSRLEEAGLVDVSVRPGRSPVVTLLDHFVAR
jgi:hypothetical protein